MKLRMPNLKLLVVLLCHLQGNCEKKTKEALNYYLLYCESLSAYVFKMVMTFNSVSLMNSTCMKNDEGLYRLT